MNVEVTDYDEQFLQKCYDFLRKNLTNSELTIEDFGKELGVSRVHLYRKIKYLTNLSPSRFILNVRLKVAGCFVRKVFLFLMSAIRSALITFLILLALLRKAMAFHHPTTSINN